MMLINGNNEVEVYKNNTDLVPIEASNKIMQSFLTKTNFNELLHIQDILLENMDNGLVSTGEEPTHFFTNGMYMRVLNIPAGELICGKRHKFSHFTLLTKGRVLIINEKDEKLDITSPYCWVSDENTKRFIYTTEDSQLITVHRTDKLNPLEVENEIIIKE